MISVEKVLFLRHAPLFATIPTRKLAHVASIAEEVVCPAGTRIFEQGERGDAMYLVVEGDVGIYAGATLLTTVTERGYFGEMSILDDEPRAAGAIATTDSLLLRIRRDDFHGILQAHPDASLAIIRTLMQRLREATAGRTTRKDSEA